MQLICRQSIGDATFYVWKDGKVFVTVAVYVYGIPQLESSDGAVVKVIRHLQQHFEVLDDEHISSFLLFTIDDNRKSSIWHNSYMTKSLLEHFGTTDCSTTKTLLQDESDLSLGQQDVVQNITSDRQLTGSLLCHTNTAILLIAFPVGH